MKLLNRHTDQIIYECKDCTSTLKLVEKAIKEGISLQEANLRGATIPIYCKWSVTLIDNSIQIGCTTKTIPEWDAWFASDDVYETPRDTEEFKRIQAMYNAYKAYYLTLNA